MSSSLAPASDASAKRLARKLDAQTFTGEDGDEYRESEFGGFKEYSARKRRKLHNLSSHLRAAASTTTANPTLFHGLVIHITGHTQPPPRELRALIVAHGGHFQQYLDGGKTSATHIVAQNLARGKRVGLARCRVVRPEWVLDSVRAGCVRPWAEYRLVEETPGQGRLAFAGAGGSGQTDGGLGAEGVAAWPSGSLAEGVTIPASDGEEDIDDDDAEEEEAGEHAPAPPRPTASTPAPVDIVDGEPLWAASCIIGQRARGRQTQYWIRWEGFPDAEATWEGGRSLVRDIGRRGLAELVREWRARPQRRVGRALVCAGVAREALLAFTAERVGFPRDYALAEVEAAFVGEEEVEEPEMEKRVEEEEEEMQPGDPYKEIRDSLSPRNLMTEEDEVALLRESIFSDAAPEPGIDATPPPGQREKPDAEKTPEGSPVVLTSLPEPVFSDADTASVAVDSTQPLAAEKVEVSRSFDYGSSVDFRELEVDTQEEGVPVSFNFGTPVDFRDDDVGVVMQFGAGAALGETEGLRAAGGESTPGNSGSMGAEGVFTAIGDDEAGDVGMSQAELLTPREELEEYDARAYEDLEPEPELGLGPFGQQVPEEGQRSDAQESEGQELDAELPPASPARDEPSSELMAAFLSKPGIRSQTVLDPGFMQSYFSHSRLHHLSTWKCKIRADLQPHIQSLTPKQNRQRRYVLHADPDSFFASASLLARPDLKAHPVAIAHGDTGGSEIAACNYPARAFGVKAGMWLHRAKALCPALVVLGYDFPRYEAASRAFYGVMTAVGAERIHAGSVDEVLLDVSNLVCDVGLGSVEEEEARVEEIARGVRERCRAATGGLEVSVGVGGNVLLAKLAMRRAKPAGVYVVKAAELGAFMDAVEVGQLPGVGPSVVGRVEESFGTGRVAEVRRLSKERLRSVLGEKTGVMLWEYCRGIDERVVGEIAVRKSLSVDVNWGVRFETASQAETFLRQLSAEVSTRLHAENLHGRHLTLTVKQRAPHAPFKPAKHLGHGECTTLSKSTLLPAPTASTPTLANAATAMLRALKIPAWELRGLGLTVAKLQLAAPGRTAGQDVLRFAKQAPVSESKKEVPWDRPLPKAYVRPKPASLLDSFLTKPREGPGPGTQVEDGAAASQFEIPEDVDEEVIPFLPPALQARIREKQRAAKERVEGEEGQGEGEGEDPLSQPPNSQDDITVWRALPAEIRSLLRSEHAAERARLAAAAAAAGASVSPPKEKEKEKRQTLLPQSPRKLPRLPWERSTTPTPATTPHPSRPTTPTKHNHHHHHRRPQAGPSNAAAAPILDARGNDVSAWLFADGAIDKSYFHAVPAADQASIVAAAVRARSQRQSVAAARARRAAAETARMEGALRLVERPRVTVLADGTPVGSLEELKALARRVCRGEAGAAGVEALEGVLRGRVEEGAVAEVEEVVRLVGVLGGVEGGVWGGVVERLERGVGARGDWGDRGV